MSEASTRDAEGIESWSDKPSVMRERLVKVDTRLLLPELSDPTPLAAIQPRLLGLDLFEDASLEVVLDRLDTAAASAQGVVWVGHVQGVESSSVTLALQGAAVQGFVELPDGRRFELTHAANGIHRVLELDPMRFPPEQEPIEIAADVATSPAEDSAASVAPDGSTVIDVMVLYTPRARTAAGGADAIEARIQQAIAVANQAYSNSLVAIRHRLVHVAPVDYVEATSGAFYTALNQITTLNDDVMDEVGALRDQHHADVVSLVIDDWSYCGMAWITDPHYASSSNRAFNVNLWYCVGATRTLHHEIGHNQGLNHDIDNAGGYGVFPYSYGLQVDGHFHTVMAYDSRFGCTAPCPPINHFSNPAVEYQGVPTGIAGAADNAASLNQTRSFVSVWRSAPACFDGSDQDADGVSDFPEDPGCSSRDDTTEEEDCGDGLDNDADGRVDFPDDDGCAGLDDPTEQSSLDDDGDTVSDDVDNCLNQANVTQRDSDRDGYGNACDADYDNDGMVGLSDFGQFQLWFTRSPIDPSSEAMDHDTDGAIGLSDFGFFSRSFEGAPGPSALACAGSVPCP